MLTIVYKKNKYQKLNLNGFKKTIINIAAFCAHISEELWSNIGEGGLCINKAGQRKNIEAHQSFVVAVQINGKTKDIIVLAKAEKKIQKYIKKKKILKEIYVPEKILNFVL